MRSMPIRGGLGRFLGFGMVPLVSAFAALVTMPAIASTTGAPGWAAIALGQSLGAGAAVIVELGWGLTGPMLVAAAPASHQNVLYRIGFWTRFWTLCVLGGGVAVAAYVLAGAFEVACALSALGGAAAGLTPAWFFIGRSDPARLLILDALPKLMFGLVGAGALLLGADLLVVPLCALSAILVSLIGVKVHVGRLVSEPEPLQRSLVLQAYRQQFVAVSGRAASGLYMALPVTLVSLVAPQATAPFAAAERLMRIGLSVVQAVPNALQGWLGRSVGDAELHRRLQFAIVANLGTGLLSAIVFAVCAPIASTMLFQGQVVVSQSLALMGGLTVLFGCTSRGVGGLGLVRLGRIGSVAFSAALGTALGVPAILFLARSHGAIGGAAGEMIAEIGVLCFQSIALRRAWRRRWPKS